MDERIIPEVARVAGITEEQAKIAIEVYVNFLKGEVSSDCVAQIEGLSKGHS